MLSGFETDYKTLQFTACKFGQKSKLFLKFVTAQLNILWAMLQYNYNFYCEGDVHGSWSALAWAEEAIISWDWYNWVFNSLLKSQ